MNKNTFRLVVSLFVLVFVLGFAGQAQANIFDDIVTGVKSFVLGDKKELTVEPEIALAPGGDVDKDGQIDAGDTLRFTYTITNETNEAYGFATLKTNINRSQLNFLRQRSNIKGSKQIRVACIICGRETMIQ